MLDLTCKVCGADLEDPVYLEELAPEMDYCSVRCAIIGGLTERPLARFTETLSRKAERRQAVPRRGAPREPGK